MKSEYGYMEVKGALLRYQPPHTESIWSYILGNPISLVALSLSSYAIWYHLLDFTGLLRMIQIFDVKQNYSYY